MLSTEGTRHKRSRLPCPLREWMSCEGDANPFVAKWFHDCLYRCALDLKILQRVAHLHTVPPDTTTDAASRTPSALQLGLRP